MTTNTSPNSIEKLRAEGKLSRLLTENPVYKPFNYPWAYEAWLTQQRIHWLPEEVPLAEDVRDWKKKLTPGERNLLTQIFRFFTQADVEVNKIKSFEAALLSYANSEYAALMAKINVKGDYNDEIEAGIKECIEKFKSTQAW